MKKLSFIILLIAACSISALSQTKKFRVDIVVAANEKQAENEARSYLGRELRSLGDVEVVNKGGELTIDVIVSKIVGNQGLMGYAISFQFLENVTCQGKSYANHIDSGLFVRSGQELREIIEEIITAFDTRVFEKRRKAK